MGEWLGVETDARGLVIALNLNENNLRGEIPSELGRLSELRQLQLYDNQLSGVIPSEMGRLGRLELLGLSSNSLVGTLPSTLGDLAELQGLYLGFNQLTGPIPRELGNLGKLRKLSLTSNQLEGIIPREIGNLSRLEILNISENRLSGRIPPELAALSNLETLWVFGNGLTGTIPTEFANRTRPLRLASGGNQLTGCISEGLRRVLSEDSNPGLANCDEQTALAPVGQTTQSAARPNLEVRIVGVARSVALDEMQPGDQIWIDTRVENNGLGDSPGTTLRYYRSNDDTIAASDIQIGTDRVVSLESGAIVDHSLRVTAPDSPGTYYYGACVDAVPGDRNPGDDCSGPLHTAVISQETAEQTSPDLVVRNVTRGGSGVQQALHVGQILTIQADVDNIGDASSRSTTLRFYLSSDSDITTGDRQVATSAPGVVQPGKNSHLFVRVNAPSNPGTYYYGACVDPVAEESDTTNNCSSALRVSIGTPPKPDLIVGSVERSGGSGAIYTGQSITLQAQVQNVGDAQAGSTTLRYYRSRDATITSGDSQVGTDRVGTVQAGRGSPQNIQLTTPSTPGTYYYGACVDAVSGEANNANNCSSALRVSIGTPPKPDLIVGSVERSGGSGAIYTGQSITLQAQVQNVGDAQSGSTILRFYQSRDATITSGDSQVGTGRVGIVQPGRNSPQSVQVPPLTNPGTYYYGACVDAVSGEANNANNCSSALRVSIGTPPKPDLIVRSVERVGGSGPIYTGQSLTLQAQVRNIGDAQSGSATLRYYRSRDATISSRDSQIGAVLVRTVQLGGSSPQSFQETAPSSPGTYYYGACVDAVSNESDTTNNCSSALTLSIGTPPKPDLIVRSVERGGGSGPVYTGQSLTLQAQVQNVGDAQSGSTTLRYYQSRDANITTGDSQVGTDRVGTVQPGRNSPQSLQVTAPSSSGSYYYGACVDAVSGEANNANNCSSALRVSIGTPPKPDLIVRSVERVGGSGPIYTGQSLTLQVQVRNIGDAQSGSATLRYYRSRDATISSRDSQIGAVLVRTVQPGGSSPQSFQETAPSSPGTYYYGACVDAVSNESDTTNNCSSALRVSIGTPPRPDLIVRSMDAGQRSVLVGQQINLTALVVNQGDGPADGSILRFYRSTDERVDANDAPVGTSRVGATQAGRSLRGSDQMPAPTRPGTYYFGACVDAVSGESNTTNNCSSFDEVEVEEPASPDLVVRLFRTNQKSAEPGGEITFSVIVRNQGNAIARSATMTIYASRSSSSRGSSFYSRGVDPLGVSLDEDEYLISRNAPQQDGRYYFQACVGSVSGESNTQNNCSDTDYIDLRETPRPDLIVRSFSANEARVDPGDEFTVSTIVRNQGDGESGSTRLTLYISESSRVATTSGNIHAYFNVPAIGRSPDEENLYLRADAPTQIGTYYLRVCVSNTSRESNTGNNCSTTDSIEVMRAFRPDLRAAMGYVGESGIIYSAGRYKMSGGVRNYGTAASTPTVLRYYRSDDDTISRDDELLSTARVAALNPDDGGSKEITAIAPRVSDTTYYFYVCIDDGYADPSGRCSAIFNARVIEPLYMNSERCSYSDDLIVDNFSFTAEIGAFTDVRDARIKGEFVIFLSGVELSRISVDEGFGNLDQYETKDITINRRIANPAHIFSSAQCRFTMDWRY